MSDDSFTSRQTTPRQNSIMRNLNRADPVEFAKGLLMAAPHKLTMDEHKDIASVEISFGQLIGSGSSGAWQQALRGLQALGFEGVVEMPKVTNHKFQMGDDGQSGTFTFDSTVFSFGDKDSHAFNTHAPLPTSITFKGAKNIELAAEIRSQNPNPQQMGSVATRTR